MVVHWISFNCKRMEDGGCWGRGVLSLQKVGKTEIPLTWDMFLPF